MTLSSVPNFASLLDETPDHVERPKPLPEGPYLCTVGRWTAGASSKKKTPFVEFPLTVVSELEGVDEESLREMGGCAGKTLRVVFYTTEDAVFMLDEFHQHCGLDLSEPLSRRMRNEAVFNATVVAYIKHRLEDLDSEQQRAGVTPRIFAEVRGTAPADE